MMEEEFGHAMVLEIPTICPRVFESSPGLGENMALEWDREGNPRLHIK
jgi:hypothetical protein